MADQHHAERMALLRRFMRDQRARWTRQELDLPSMNGHKTLSQQDLAALAGYDPAHITAFETGRMRNPSNEFLEAVATALRMSPAERKHVWNLAKKAEPPPTADCEKMWGHNPALHQGIEAAGDRGDPAFLMDPAFRVMAYNRATTQWICDFDQHPDIHHNMALWMFTPHARHVFPEWRQQAAHMIARVRAVHAHLPGDPFVTQLIRRLGERSPLARQLWREDTTVLDWPLTRVLRVPGHTDPDQPDDAGHQVTANMSFLQPPTPGDERLLVTFLLPHERPVLRPTVISEQACTACARLRATAASGAA